MISQQQKREEIGWVTTRDVAAENAIDDSWFIREIGVMDPDSEERERYIAEHETEKAKVLGHLMAISGYKIYKENKKEKEELVAKFGQNFDNLLFYKQYEIALHKWNSKNENGVKLFRNYVIEGYVDAKYYEKIEEKRKHENTGCSQHVIEIANKVKQVIPGITQNGGDWSELVNRAIQVVKEGNPQVKESTWKNVERYLREGFGVMHLNTPLDDFDDEEWIDVVSDSHATSEDDIINALELQEEMQAKYQMIIEQINNATNKNREWMRRGYTGRIIKVLKYEDGKPIEEMPAGNKFRYISMKKMAQPIMKNIIDQNFVNYIIREIPKSLCTFEGIYWNLFREGRLVTNKCLAECIRQKEPVTEATVSNRLNALDVAFAKI